MDGVKFGSCDVLRLVHVQSEDAKVTRQLQSRGSFLSLYTLSLLYSALLSFHFSLSLFLFPTPVRGTETPHPTSRRQMAKGLFSSLKGVDAFGKVRFLIFLAPLSWQRHRMLTRPFPFRPLTMSRSKPAPERCVCSIRHTRMMTLT